MVDELHIITKLVLKKISGKPLEEQEMLRLQSWLEESPDNALLLERMQDEEWLEERLLQGKQVNKGKIRATVFASIVAQKTQPARKRIWYRYLPAAAILFLLIGGWIYVTRRSNKTPVIVVQQVAPAPVMREQAVLTLDNGSEIILDTARNGVVAQQGKTKVIKQGGRVEYHMPEPEYHISENTPAGVPSPPKNKLTVPGGRTYRLQLPDGTWVWINSGSSLEYPTIFTGKNREVTLNGEAYFEVAKDANHPFRVRADDQLVTDVGTSFNVRCYSVEKWLFPFR